MSKIRGKNTSLELVMFRALSAVGIRFRRHYHTAFGVPDIALPKNKIAVFIDGDFWHGYRYPAWKHKIRLKFWRDKIERNRARDRRHTAGLRRHGWRVLRIWEHDIKKDPERAVLRVLDLLRDSSDSFK